MRASLSVAIVSALLRVESQQTGSVTTKVTRSFLTTKFEVVNFVSEQFFKKK